MKFLDKLTINIPMDSKLIVKDKKALLGWIQKISRLNFNLNIKFCLDSYDYLLKQEDVKYMK